MRLATTTSIENSGILKVLLPPFERRCRCAVDVIAVGTGKALKLARNGDVDAVLVHNPEMEEEFVREAFGVHRREVMYNDFVLLGPPDDPAGVRSVKSGDALTHAGSRDVTLAFRRIAERRATFCSRGDKSGTHMKEKALWQAAGVTPSGTWYIETGQGMAATLIVADERKAYVLSDRATYLALQDGSSAQGGGRPVKIALVICYEGDSRLLNPYTIMAVNPRRHPHVKFDLAMRLIEFVTSPDGQRIIANFKVNDEQIFHPVCGLAP